MGGNTPLPITVDICWDWIAVETLEFVWADPPTSLELSSHPKGCGTDLAFTSSKFSTTYPMLGPARYLIL